MSDETSNKPTLRGWVGSLKDRRKELFWAWITYQAVKGLITTSLIWVPLITWWWTRSG